VNVYCEYNAFILSAARVSWRVFKPIIPWQRQNLRYIMCCNSRWPDRDRFLSADAATAYDWRLQRTFKRKSGV